MAFKTTLNAKNLEALGAVQLAELLMEISEGKVTAAGSSKVGMVFSKTP